MLRRPARTAALLVGLALVAVGCDDGDATQHSRIRGDTLTVYSSQPLHGPLAPVSRQIVRAQKLALRDAGGRAGPYTVNYVPLDSANPRTGRWDPARVAANARQAVDDRQTIAYLGELESGASAVSLPILNEAGILQVSPRDTFAGLTSGGPGANRGEPEKYYPSGVRTFARLVPADVVQARALLRMLESAGVRRLAVADDGRLAGMSLTDRVARLAEQAGIEVVERLRVDASEDVPDDLGRDLREADIDAFFYGGAYRDSAVELLEAVGLAVPGVRLLAGDGLAVAPELPRRAGPAVRGLDLTAIDPHPAGDVREFERRYARTYGERPGRQAILGYRAMRVVLDAIEAAGADAGNRRSVVQLARRAALRPRADFVRMRLDGSRLVPVGPGL